jgi:hypothetical protein
MDTAQWVPNAPSHATTGKKRKAAGGSRSLAIRTPECTKKYRELKASLKCSTHKPVLFCLDSGWPSFTAFRPLIGRGCRALPPSVALCLPYATGSAAEAVPRAAAIGRGAGGQPLPPTGRLSFQPRRLCHRSFTLGSSPFEPPGHYSQEKYSSQAHENYFLA